MKTAKRLLVLVAALTMGALPAKADADAPLAIAIGTPGSDSFTFGTELWAMSQIALLPKHEIALASREVAADEDRLSLLQKREVAAALVYGRVPNAYDDDVRAIMALWPEGVSSDDSDPVQFLVHKDVAGEVVYLLTKAMFEHADSFRSAHANLGIGSPSVAMTGLDIPLHAGAYRYYSENGVLDETMTADYWGDKQPAADGEAAESFRDFDDASLEPEEIKQIAAACRHALEVGALSLVLGDLDNTGCEVYQDRLALDRDGRGGEDIFAAPTGQGGPAIRWEPASDAGGEGTSDTPAHAVRKPVM